MKLNINDDSAIELPTAAAIRTAIQKLPADQFIILEDDDQHYIQAFHNEDGSYQLELRAGSEHRHFAVDSKSTSAADVADAFLLFLERSEDLASRWDWSHLIFDDDDDDDGGEDQAEYNGVMMAAGWPQAIEDAQDIDTISIMGAPYVRVRFGTEKHLPTSAAKVCGDCGVLPGQFHVPGCDIEECPRCGEPRLSCDCEVDQED